MFKVFCKQPGEVVDFYHIFDLIDHQIKNINRPQGEGGRGGVLKVTLWMKFSFAIISFNSLFCVKKGEPNYIHHLYRKLYRK